MLRAKKQAKQLEPIQETPEKSRVDLVKQTVDILMKDAAKSIGKGGATGSPGNCHHGYLDIKGQHLNSHHACHSAVRRWVNPVVFYNRYCKRPKSQLSDDANRAYFEFITGDDSPWKIFSARNISHTPLSLEVESGDAGTKNWIYDNGWVWSNLNHPVNLQHSFLTGARMAPEWPEHIGKWDQWVKNLGHDKYRALAFVFLTLFQQLQQDRKKFLISYMNKYDWPLDTGSCDEEYVKNFCLGTPVGPWGKNFSESSNYTPVNSIWGKSNITNKKETYIYSVFDRYSKTHGPVEEDCKKYWDKNLGLSVFDYSAKWYVSKSELIDIIRCEYRRLFETKPEKKESEAA